MVTEEKIKFRLSKNQWNCKNQWNVTTMNKNQSSKKNRILLHPLISRTPKNLRTMLCYNIGDGMVARAGQQPDLVGRVRPATGLTPRNKGMTQNVVLRVEKQPNPQSEATC